MTNNDKNWNKARQLVREGNSEGALFIMKSLANKGELAAYREIGRIYEKRENYNEAVNWYSKSIEEADDIEGYLAMARLSYVGVGTYQSKETAFKYLDLIEGDNNHKAFLLKARLYTYDKDYENAKKYYKKSYELGNIVALSEFASVCKMEGKYLEWLTKKLKVIYYSFKIYRKDKYSEFLRAQF